MSLEEYFQLLVFTGKQGRSDKRGKIKAEGETTAASSATAILSKLGIADGMWCDLVWNLRSTLAAVEGGFAGQHARRCGIA